MVKSNFYLDFLDHHIAKETVQRGNLSPRDTFVHFTNTHIIVYYDPVSQQADQRTIATVDHRTAVFDPWERRLKSLGAK